MILILMGPPGAGKGSQAELLTVKYNIPHISTGDIFRYNFKEQTPIGKIAKEYIDKGQFVPDKLTNDIVRERLLKKDVEAGFMLDGYPRNLNQAEALDKLLVRLGMEIDAVINIDAKDEVLIKRISGRRVCSSCGAVYHIDNKKTRHEGICDVCGSKVILRKDDEEETVKERLSIYHDQTKPLVEYYENKGLLKTVDGNISIEHTFNEIVKILGDDVK